MALTRKRLKEMLEYHPGSGVFTWVKHRHHAKIGTIAGWLCERGYVFIRIGAKPYYAHRLAWFYMRGRWPREEIDHINGDRSDNRFCNIRCATRSLNSQNMKGPRANNKYGFLGVQPKDGRWAARIQSEYKIFRLGNFDTPQEAAEAYLKAKRKLHKGCTI